MKSEWNMPRRAEVCAACRREFAPGEPLQACLYQTGEAYVRRDFCPTCAPPASPAPLATWRTRRPAPTDRKTPAFDRHAIHQLFERLEEAGEPQQLQLRFVLALLLWRKRILRLDRTVGDRDLEIWEFTAPATGATHRVLRPELDEPQLERLSRRLEDLLAGRAGPADLPLTVADKEPCDDEG